MFTHGFHVMQGFCLFDMKSGVPEGIGAFSFKEGAFLFLKKLQNGFEFSENLLYNKRQVI